METNNHQSDIDPDQLEDLFDRLDMLKTGRGVYYGNRFTPFRPITLEDEPVDSTQEQQQVADKMFTYVERQVAGSDSDGDEVKRNLARVAVASMWLTGSNRNASISFGRQFDRQVWFDNRPIPSGSSYHREFNNLLEGVADDIKYNSSEDQFSEPFIERKLMQDVSIKEKVELLASRNRGVMLPDVAIGILLLTDQVDADKLSLSERKQYVAHAKSDMYRRIKHPTYRAGAVERVMSDLIGSPSDDKPARSYEDLLNECEARFTNRNEAQRHLERVVAYELELMYEAHLKIPGV